MRTKLRTSGLTLEAHLVAEAVSFLKANYKEVPEVISGSLFHICKFVNYLIGKEEENIGLWRAGGRFSEMLHESPLITAALLNHMLIVRSRFSFLRRKLREHKMITVKRNGKLREANLRDASDKEIADFLQNKYKPTPSIVA
jgi:hypothetical protein